MALEQKIDVKDFRVFELYDHGPAVPRFLLSTRLYPEWLLAKLPHTSRELAEKVTAALLRLSPEDPAAIAAKCSGWTIPLNYQSVHECLKILRTSPYEEYGKVTLRDVLRHYRYWILGTIILGIGLIVFAVYVSRLNRKLRSAVEEKSQLAAIVESSEDAIISRSSDGTVLSWNAAAERIYGYTAGETIGKSMSEILPSDYRSVEFQEVLAKIKRSEIIEQYETKRTRKDGRIIHVSLTISSIKDSTGQIIGSSTIARDITERKAIDVFK